MKYCNLDLQASGYEARDGSERFSVCVLKSPVGEQRLDLANKVTLPADLRQQLRLLEKRELTLEEMIDLGEVLGDMLFPPRGRGSARWFLDRSRAKLGEDECLRIRLRLETYALADLPWEYAYIPHPDTSAGRKGPDGFLVLDPRTSLARYEVLPQSLGSLKPVGAGPLRMVVLLADPQTPGYADLDLEADLANIQEALQEVPGIQFDAYPDATRQTLLDAVEGDAHIFHFAGHGEFQGDLGRRYGTEEGKGYLVLVGDRQQAELLEADTLALNLRGRKVRLAVLGACDAGRRDGINAWTGVVPALTKAGIPAVVGNQYSIRDVNAIAFHRRFYRALADGDSIDGAVTDGRLAIYTLSGGDDRDWGVPVLYLRAEEGVLFPRDTRVTQPTVVSRPGEAGAADVDRSALRRAMAAKMTEANLEALCADVEQDLTKDGYRLQVDLEVVGGRGLEGKILRLIDYLDRREVVSYLADRLRKDWPWVIKEYEMLA